MINSTLKNNDSLKCKIQLSMSTNENQNNLKMIKQNNENNVQQKQEQQLLQMKKTSNISTAIATTYYFLHPPINYNKNYHRMLEESTDHMSQNSNILQALYVDQLVKEQLKKLSKGLVQKIIQSIKILSGEQTTINPKIQANKMSKKAKELYQMCHQIKVAEARQSVCKIMLEETKQLYTQVDKLNNLLNVIRQKGMSRIKPVLDEDFRCTIDKKTINQDNMIKVQSKNQPLQNNNVSQQDTKKFIDKPMSSMNRPINNRNDSIEKKYLEQSDWSHSQEDKKSYLKISYLSNQYID